MLLECRARAFVDRSMSLSRLLLNASCGVILLLLFGTGGSGEDERRHRHTVDVLGGHQELLPGMYEYHSSTIRFFYHGSRLSPKRRSSTETAG